jgi:hypothetical protein
MYVKHISGRTGPAAAMFVLLATATRARIVAPNGFRDQYSSLTDKTLQGAEYLAVFVRFFKKGSNVNENAAQFLTRQNSIILIQIA